MSMKQKNKANIVIPNRLVSNCAATKEQSQGSEE